MLHALAHEQRGYHMHNLPRQECIEGEVGDKNAVEELDDAGKHEEDQECVDRFEPRRGRVIVRRPQGQERRARRFRRWDRL